MALVWTGRLYAAGHCHSSGPTADAGSQAGPPMWVCCRCCRAAAGKGEQQSQRPAALKTQQQLPPLPGTRLNPVLGIAHVCVARSYQPLPL